MHQDDPIFSPHEGTDSDVDVPGIIVSDAAHIDNDNGTDIDATNNPDAAL